MIPTTKPKLFQEEYGKLLTDLLFAKLITHQARRFNFSSIYKCTKKGYDFYETILAIENMKQLYDGPIILNPKITYPEPNYRINHHDIGIEKINIFEDEKMKYVINELTLRRCVVLIDIMKGRKKYEKYAYDRVGPFSLILTYVSLLIIALIFIIKGGDEEE